MWVREEEAISAKDEKGKKQDCAGRASSCDEDMTHLSQPNEEL